MRPILFWHSLRFKITAGITLPLLVILSAFSFLQYANQREILLSNLDHSANNLGNVIVGSLERAMLSQDLADIQGIVDNIAKQEGISDVFLLNKRGEIRSSPQRRDFGLTLQRSAPGCIECHGSEERQNATSIVFTNANGERVFRNCKPILNQPACQTCHSAQDKFNGVLVTDLSMQKVDDLLALDLRTNILWSSLAILATIIAVNALMSRMVVTRLERLVQAIRQFSRGDLASRVPKLSSQDEIADVAETFNRMAQQVLEHTRELERLNEELHRKETLRGQLLGKLITAQEEERKRIARDLHDQLGQALSAMTMGMEGAERALSPSQDGLRERLLHAKALAIHALEQTHALILDLRPVALEDLGLFPAMRSYAEQHLVPRGVDVQATVRGTPHRLAPEVEIALFRIVQEAINNIANHAQARHVRIELEFCEASIRVLVEDDGCGFDRAGVLMGTDAGLGLLGMQERVTLADGAFHLTSAPGCGTLIEIMLPITEPAPAPP